MAQRPCGSGPGCGRGARARGRTGLASDAARGVGAGSQSGASCGGCSCRPAAGRCDSRRGERRAAREEAPERGRMQGSVGSGGSRAGYGRARANERRR